MVSSQIADRYALSNGITAPAMVNGVLGLQ